jgi:hypothetical protein
VTKFAVGAWPSLLLMFYILLQPAVVFHFLLPQLLEAVTKFAVVRMAITGDALMPSCRSTADLLARNLLDSVGVWWFPGMILQVRQCQA